MPDARLGQLDAAIQTMMSELPLDVRAHVEKMHKKRFLAIVPLAAQVCSACGVVLPVSQVHAVRAAMDLYRCANCARYLFYPEAAPRHISKKQSRGLPPKVGIARFSSPELMIPQLKAESRDEAVAEMCQLLKEKGFVDNAERLVEESLRREAIASTAVDKGLAFPHVRGVEGGGLTLALGISKKGIKFGGPVKTLSRIVFFIVIPTAASAFYLKLLSGLTQALREEEERQQLLETKTPEALWKALVKVTRSTVV